MIAALLCASLAIQAKTVATFRDQVYAEGGGKSQSLDLYIPSGGAPKKALIVWVHGGGWRQGSKEGGPIQPLIRAGFAVASINYRLSQEALFPAQIEDCKAAVRWLRANADRFGLDKGRFGAWGGSAGGHLVALLGTSGGVKELEGDKLGNSGESSRVQAVCDFYGPIDFEAMSLGSMAEGGKDAVALLLGGPVATKRDLAAMANPIKYITRDDPPFFICHGDKDGLVPDSQSKLLHAALQKAGVSSDLLIVPGGSHGNLGPTTTAKVVAFFKAKL